MSVTESHILKALGNVEDPDLKKDLVSLNMIEDLSIDGSNVRFTVVLTTPACPLKEYLKNACLEAIKEIDSKLEVEINMTSNVTSTRDNTPMLPGVKNIIAIASGKGGVGKSTVSANLAVALANSGASVGLIDADIYGPSIHTMFNVENEKPQIFKKGEKHLIIPLEQYGVKLISIGVLTPAENPTVWRGPMASSAFKQFISDVEWGPLDYMLIDLPPGTSDIHLTLVQTLPVTGAIIVTTPQKVAVADATKGLAMFRQPQINVPILGIIENMAYFTPEELPENKYYIFGKDGGKNLAEKYDVELLGQIPLIQNIREGGDGGYPAVLKEDVSKKAFSDVAEASARQIAIRNANFAATKKVEMKA